MDALEIQKRMRSLLARLAGCGVPPEQLRDMLELSDCGEWRIALENLCTQLHELDCALDEEVYREIEALAREMKLAEKYLLRLQPQVR